MGFIISKFAFLPHPPSYGYMEPYLDFITREDMTSSYIDQYQIPIKYYHHDDDFPTMIICHGNSEDIGGTDPKLISKQFKCNVCLFDYAGYGLHSCREPSEYHCQQDVKTVYHYLVSDKKIPPNKIVIYGRSLGTGIACYLAHHLSKQNQDNKLILVSPLLSCTHIVTDLWSPCNMFMNYSLAPAIQSSTLIIHGDCDEVVPYEHGVKLSKLFTNLYEFVTLNGFGHNNILASSTYYDTIYHFLNPE
jgi:pimeloyl-ACP methyl ester carboxylesterase